MLIHSTELCPLVAVRGRLDHIFCSLNTQPSIVIYGLYCLVMSDPALVEGLERRRDSVILYFY